VNDYVLSAILGVIEGLTEFLPISSTAHLRLAESFVDLSLADPYWKMYTIVIQLGAVLCLPIYFRRRIAEMLATFPRGARGDRTIVTHPLSLTMIAFVITAVPTFLLVNVVGKRLESRAFMGTTLLVGGVVMWMVDAWFARSEALGPGAPGSRITTWRMDAMGLGQAIWIGACQILSAIFPGTSRSMATIAGGQLAGMSRAAALEFSFFLSLPTMAVATGYELLAALLGLGKHAIEVKGVDAHGWAVLAVGFVVSFVVAWASVAGFMSWVRTRRLTVFAVYRVVIGTLVLIFGAALWG
jgi:undecaprenyl-diphosphatase